MIIPKPVPVQGHVQGVTIGERPASGLTVIAASHQPDMDAILAQALNALPSPVLLIDADANIRYANGEASDFLGYPISELIGISVAKVDRFFPHDLLPLPVALTDDSRISSRIWRRQNGTEVVVECQLSLTTSASDTLLLVIGRDLTRQLESDSSISENDARFRSVFEDAGVGMIMIDPQGTFLKVNDAFVRMLGYERNEVSGRPINDFVHPDDLKAASNLLRAWTPGLRFHSRAELRFRGNDGRPVWTQVTFSATSASEKDVPTAVAQVQDITDYQLAVQALRLSQVKFRDFASAASDWMWETDADSRFSYFSHRLTEMTGVSAMKLLGKCIGDAEITEAFAPEQFEVLMKDLAERRAFRNIVCTYRRDDGSTTHLSLSGKPIFDEDGTFRGYRGTGTDITERLVAEDALRLSEYRLRRSVVDAPIPMMIHAEDGEVVLVSQAWSELSGYAHEDVPTTASWIEQAYPEAREHEEAAAWMAALYGIEQRTESSLRTITTKAGSLRKWDFRSSPLGQSADGRRYVITMAIDVTDRFAAEQKLQILSRAVDQSASAMAIADPAGIVRYVNRKFVEMTGYSEAEACGETLAMYLDVGDATWFERIRQAPERHDSWQKIVLSRRKSGEAYWERVAVFGVRDEGGTVTNFVAIKEDITEQKRTEFELHAAMERAEIANRAKSDFLANMSHELRTPLNAIIGFSETMTTEMFGPLGSPKYEEYSNDIRQSARHLLGIINDILDLSKIEAGKFELDTSPLDLCEVIRLSTDLIRPRVTEAGIALTLHLSPDMPLVFGDERAMRQILLNLLSNAAKFTPMGGSICVSAGLTEGGAVELSIADTGIGIHEKDIEVVLRPFGQADSALNRKFEGTGLGLSITKSLVETLGGDLELKSTPGVGTTVFVRLPRDCVVT